MTATRQGNKLGRSCVIEEKSAALSGDFGLKMLRLKFPAIADAILAKLGTYSRGPRKGLPRGYVHWTKVLEGGWHYGHGGVLRPGTFGWVIRANADPRSESVSGAVLEEREAVERDAKTAAWEAMSAREKWIARAVAARRTAHKELRDGDTDEFHFSIRRARHLVRQAREART